MTRINRDYIVAAALFIAGFSYTLIYYDYGLNLLDEGYLMMSSLRVLHGEIPYIDFQSNYAPGRYYLFATLFGIFGENFLITRIVWVVLYAAIAAMTYLIARKAVKPHYAVIAAAISLILRCPWQKTFFVFFQVLCIWVFFNFLETRKKSALIACGFVTAVTLYIRHDIGIYAFIAFAASIVAAFKDDSKEMSRTIVQYMGYLFLFLAPLFVFYAYHGALLTMLDQYLFSGLRDVSASKLPYPGVESFSSGVLLLIMVFPVGLYAISALVLIIKAVQRNLRKQDLYLFFLTLFGPLIYLQIVNRTDLPHLWQVFPPASLTLFFLLSDMTSSRLTAPAKVIFAAATVLILSCYLAVYFSTLNPQVPPFVSHKEYVKLDIKGARVKIPKEEAKNILNVKEFIDGNTGRNDYILAIPDIPMFYFLCNRRNPLRYDLLRPGIADRPQLQDETIESLKGKGVPYMIFNDNETFDNVPERKFEKRSSVIYNYLTSNYVKVKKIDGFSIWMAACLINGQRPSIP